MPIAAAAGIPYAELGATALQAARDHLGKGESLTKLRDELKKLLHQVPAPIVILIDELDRVEDADIRTVAQLVRAVADFPGLSYVLAYDADRVSEALGGDARGRSYLEKIVQIQIPIPSILPEELNALFAKEFGALVANGFAHPNWERFERFQQLREIAIPDILETLMIDTGVWDDDCRRTLTNQISGNPLAVVSLSILMFGGLFKVDKSFGSKIVDTNVLCKRAHDIQASNLNSLHPSAINALQQVLNEWD